MPRPKCCRRVDWVPGCRLFKPAGVPAATLEQLVLTIDELEALRLADVEGLYHELAAERMGVSRQTFGRIVEAARRKAARALLEGKALRIEGGSFEMTDTRTFRCSDCAHEWQVPDGTGRPDECPGCKSENIHRAVEERGGGGGRGRHRHGCCGARSRSSRATNPVEP